MKFENKQNSQQVIKPINRINDKINYLSIKESANYLNLSTIYIHKLIKNKEIDHYRPTGENGKKIYIKKTSLDEWMENGLIKKK